MVSAIPILIYDIFTYMSIVVKPSLEPSTTLTTNGVIRLVIGFSTRRLFLAGTDKSVSETKREVFFVILLYYRRSPPGFMPLISTSILHVIVTRATWARSEHDKQLPNCSINKLVDY